jgi:phage FluMu protein gp41
MEDALLGTTDRSIFVWIADPAATDGGGKTAIAHTDLTVSYSRMETDNDATVTDVTSSLNALTNLTDAHNDWGWKEISATLAPGLYRLDLADAVFASGAWYAVVQVTLTTSLASPTPKGFRLVSRNDLDGVRLGLTALPNAAPDAAGGLPISDAGGLDLDAQVGTKINDILTDTAEIGAAGAGLTNINLPNQTMDIVGNITGNLSGSVGSVTGLTAADVAAIKVITDALTAAAAAKLALSAGQIITGTIDTTVAPSTTEFEADDITEATADHYNGRVVIFTSGVLAGQATSISDYALAGGKGHFTVVAMTEAPGNNDTFIIV